MFKKLLLPLLILLAFPFIVILINKTTSLYYNHSYADASQGAISSAHYRMIPIKLPGDPQEFTGYTPEVDTMYIDTIPTTPIDSSITPKPDPKSFKTYGGKVYIDTLKRLIYLETRQDSIDNNGFTGDFKQHYLTLNLNGKIIADSIIWNPKKELTYLNCYLIPDVLVPFQPWMDESKPLSLRHFGRTHLNTNCFDPFRGWGNPNGSGYCYFWEGTGYYAINFHDELLKFKLPASTGALLFSQNMEFSHDMNYYPVPKGYQKIVDAAFLVYKNQIYMVSEK